MDNFCLVLITVLILIVFLKYTASGQKAYTEIKKQLKKIINVLPFVNESLGGVYTGPDAIKGGINNTGNFQTEVNSFRTQFKVGSKLPGGSETPKVDVAEIKPYKGGSNKINLGASTATSKSAEQYQKMFIDQIGEDAIKSQNDYKTYILSDSPLRFVDPDIESNYSNTMGLNLRKQQKHFATAFSAQQPGLDFSLDARNGTGAVQQFFFGNTTRRDLDKICKLADSDDTAVMSNIHPKPLEQNLKQQEQNDNDSHDQAKGVISQNNYKFKPIFRDQLCEK